MQTTEGKSPDIPAHTDTPGPEAVQEKKVNDALKVCQAHEQEMSSMMTQVIRSSKSNYRFKASTNSILVIIGTILIASPIAFTWLKSTGMFPAMTNDMGLTNLNYFLGGIGIVAFVTTFFNKPQKQMAIAIADLAPLFIVCNMYRVQFYAIAGRLSQEYAKMPPDERTMDHVCKDLYRVTKDTAELIDHYIEKYARFDGKGGPSLSLADVDRFQSLGKDRKDVQSETTDTTSIDKQASPS